ncbi:hypothetical protein E2C01_014474 [Portunus trituberculatus]|uniref:Uncharacterized protein n=1 Tax=Portunus trituberculatus TaxID=210409 RepID=A0A5B7DK07_PORTR|nr:hypothetical protein [Portunus trituberculatus]
MHEADGMAQVNAVGTEAKARDKAQEAALSSPVRKRKHDCNPPDVFPSRLSPSTASRRSRMPSGNAAEGSPLPHIFAHDKAGQGNGQAAKKRRHELPTTANARVLPICGMLAGSGKLSHSRTAAVLFSLPPTAFRPTSTISPPTTHHWLYCYSNCSFLAK